MSKFSFVPFYADNPPSSVVLCRPAGTPAVDLPTFFAMLPARRGGDAGSRGVTWSSPSRRCRGGVRSLSVVTDAAAGGTDAYRLAARRGDCP